MEPAVGRTATSSSSLSGEVVAKRVLGEYFNNGNIPINLMIQLATEGFDVGSTNNNKKPAAKETIVVLDSDDDTKKKPAAKETIVVLDSDDDTNNNKKSLPKLALEDDSDFNTFIDGVQESVCDPDKVLVVLNDIPSKKRFSERIVLKYRLTKGCFKTRS